MPRHQRLEHTVGGNTGSEDQAISCIVDFDPGHFFYLRQGLGGTNQRRIPREALTDLADRPVEQRPSLVDQQDPVAHLLHLVHLVRGHDHAHPPVCQLAEQVFDHPGVDRVQAGERLVDDHQVGLVQQGGDGLGFLLHALAQLFDLFLPVLRQVKALQVRRRQAAGFLVNLPQASACLREVVGDQGDW